MLPEHVRVVRLDDPDRREAWTAGLRPTDLVAFASYDDSGAPCDADGHPFASSADVTCLVFDQLADARRFCEAKVLSAPHVRFEIVDSAGRVNPPLLVVVHPGRAHSLTGNPRSARTRRIIALVLIAGAFPLFWLDYQRDGLLILPTVLGLNMLLIGARLLFMNLTVRDVEKERQERLSRYESR
ncbi:MAG TPA: hypothetical protein VHI99_21385 [Vicinamibacterales bacterium]|nr:hypothetical protein [Vicinamibacterales bacterium]